MKSLPTMVIWLTAAVWAGIGMWFGISPQSLLSIMGVEESTPQLKTEMRAFYGGVELAIAVVMLILWRRQESFAALLVGGVPLGFSAAGRCLGMAVDGFSSLHLGLAAVEASGALLCLYAATLVTHPATGPCQQSS
ncbi:MAG: DUF4345 family protein [Pirellulaceae bacterium]|nr:DUF4345 family protein [Pirellulaceae bacterium]